jgi:hypothetical protein
MNIQGILNVKPKGKRPGGQIVFIDTPACTSRIAASTAK